MAYTVVSPSNIAFIKYWGQRDSSLVLPCNDSFSMNLSACVTEIAAEFFEDPAVRELEIMEYGSGSYTQATEAELSAVTDYYNVAKRYLRAESDFGFRLRSKNTFPKKAGIASSASFFSAMALVLARGFGRVLAERELSILARLSGSGSACRSIPDGFVWWHAGHDSASSYAESIAPAEAWALADIVLIVSEGEKRVSSRDGHKWARTSLYYEDRQNRLSSVSLAMREAFERKDFTRFGTLLEGESFNFHAIMMTQQPPLLFWSDRTVRVLSEIHAMRRDGIEAYATIDAGENVHLICEAKTVESVLRRLAGNPAIRDSIVNYPAIGARSL